MTKIAFLGKYEALCDFRRGGDWQVKPEAEALDGQRIRVQAIGRLDDDDSRYPGEWMMRRDVCDEGPSWIASGDLTDISPTPPESPE